MRTVLLGYEKIEEFFEKFFVRRKIKSRKPHSRSSQGGTIPGTSHNSRLRYCSGGYQLQQTFRKTKPEVEAVEGDDVVLPCEIDNLHGRVQWTLDGMALGYDSKIPGHPRYEMFGDRDKGIFNLLIRNVSLEDDAEFQCQVGRKLINNSILYELNKTVVRLNVISPPASIEMIDRANKSVAAVAVNSELKLQCLVRSSRPMAEIVWFRERTRIREGYTSEVQECRTVPNKTKNVEKCDVMSTIILKPSLHDESINYSCHAKHGALQGRPPLFSTVQLSVLYPPEPPHIDNYIEGDQSDVLSEGMEHELICRSSNGNPLAELLWYKNGVRLRKNSYYKTFGKVSQSSLKINLEADDNQANYTCESKNGALKTPLKTSVQMSVSFGPKSVELVGPENAKAGEMISIECKSSSSNPAAEIQWVMDGQRVTNKSHLDMAPGQNGGFITTSWLEITVPSERKELIVHCYANNPRSSKNVMANTTVHIHYPPGAPIITGPVKGGFFSSGAIQRMMCTSTGGNPLADLTWFKNNQKISSVTKKSDRASSFAEISIVASKTDNGAVYKCEAKNPTIHTPLFDSVRLNVYFPPEYVKIDVQPGLLQVGTIARITCNTSSSNPPAQISWWRDNAIQISDGISYYSDIGQYGGNVTFSELQLNVSADMHNSTITCKAMNPVLQQGVNDATDLNVLYKPIFVEVGRKLQYSKIEGESFSVMFKAHGNPSSIVYRWLKNGRQLASHYSEDSSLTISKLRQNDAGTYTCEAENSEGTARISFELNVKYEASIIGIKKKVLAANGSDVEMSCRVAGNPLDSEDVSWINSNISDWDRRTSITFHNNTSILKLSQATVRDMGLFYCIVNNGIGAEQNASTRLIVEHAPVSSQTSQLIKVAPDSTGIAKFICLASGAPEVDFSWFKNDTLINRTVNYDIRHQKIDDLNYKSTLLVKRVHPSDYGRYSCIARNTIAHVKITYELNGYSKPDQPLNLQAINISHNSVTIMWDLQFTGGLPPTFVISYYPANAENEMHQEEIKNHTIFTVNGLSAATTYIFNVKAKNKLGESADISINATTVAASSRVEIDEEGSVFLLLILALVGSVFLCNTLICLCCCRYCRKTKKGLPEMRNKSLELYAPASRSSNGMSMSTVSSLQSEKSANFATSDDNRNHINDDRHDLPLTYHVVEDINYPFMENGESETQFKHDSDEKYIKSPYNRYSTLSHLQLHSLQQSLPSFGYDMSPVSDIVGTTTIPRKKSNHLPDLGYPRDISPAPSLPPPMTSISTQAYRSLHSSNNFLRL